MDMAVRSIQPFAMQRSNEIKQFQAAADGRPQIQQDSVQISANALENGTETGGIKESVKNMLGSSIRMSAGILGGATGLILAPIGGIALGAYSGVTGRTHYSVGPIEEPGLVGATVHKKILKKTGSKALAMAGGVAVGVPGGAAHALVLFPILGFVTSYEKASSLVKKMFGK
ncbi:MAG: hypothetical protein AB9903_02375 [Vulcanimicrobiota bacterium]